MDNALICAYLSDGSERAVAVDAKRVEAWTPDAGLLWVHLDRSCDETESGLRDSAGLDPFAVEALLAEETRPRSESIGNGLLVTLRDVNLNVGAEP